MTLRMAGLMAALMALGTALASAQAPKEMSVQLRNAQIRATASFLGRVVAEVPYGTRVTVLQTRAPWSEVRSAEGQTGWMHESALSEKKLTLASSGGDVRTTASSSEVSLAAKGFTDQVEKDFKAKNREIDFKWVDWMEKIRLTPEQSGAFLRQGQVTPKTGEAK